MSARPLTLIHFPSRDSVSVWVTVSNRPEVQFSGVLIDLTYSNCPTEFRNLDVIKLGPPFPQVQTTVTGKTWVGLLSYVDSARTLSHTRHTHGHAITELVKK